MKLEEVLHMGGVEQFVRPGTMVSQQVVQPRTLQANEPEQGEDYEKAKSRQKELHQIEIDVYNNRDIDKIKDPYDDAEELNKKVNKTIFSIDNNLVASIDLGYEEFAKKANSELEDE